MGPFCRLYDVISDKGQLSNGIKGARIWIPSRHGKGGCTTGRDITLLLKCFITIMRYISKAGVASDCICDPVMVHIVSFLLVSTLKLHTKLHNWGTLSAHEWDTVLQ